MNDKVKVVDNTKDDTNEVNDSVCISEKTLSMMDESMKSLSNGLSGKALDISKLKEKV